MGDGELGAALPRIWSASHTARAHLDRLVYEVAASYHTEICVVALQGADCGVTALSWRGIAREVVESSQPRGCDVLMRARAAFVQPLGPPLVPLPAEAPDEIRQGGVRARDMPRLPPHRARAPCRAAWGRQAPEELCAEAPAPEAVRTPPAKRCPRHPPKLSAKGLATRAFQSFGGLRGPRSIGPSAWAPTQPFHNLPGIGLGGRARPTNLSEFVQIWLIAAKFGPRSKSVEFRPELAIIRLMSPRIWLISAQRWPPSAQRFAAGRNEDMRTKLARFGRKIGPL